MKLTFALTTVATALWSSPVTAWWDNGHMLVGQVATQLMAPKDVATIESVLSKWEADFPNTNTITTAAIWPDLVKCKKVTSYCTSPLTPSLGQMEEWHFVDLPVNTDGSDWNGKEADFDLFKESLGGEAVDFIEKSMSIMATTKSNWAANLVLRNVIHVIGDLHQPLHTVGGVTPELPKGDQGGNSWVFQQPCPATNLHALWDAAGGEYSLNNWAPKIDFQDKLEKNATELLSYLPSAADGIDFEQYKDLPYEKFQEAMVKGNGIKSIILDSYNYAQNMLYPSLDLTNISDKKDITVVCPADWYFTWAAQVAKMRIAQGGKRLSVVLTQFARQLRARGLGA
ncbi:TPA: hypothetical protein N0F65_004958 [Lagenidium giganteum]|uniref:S1/P1 nuclease n=1 Tax=Lagenidium giganteum TaxID=4803 RepID=A0AAV2YJG8_9STRA|nr:TPA: hypothetical protein N0F65_004958 [Lagenidium giganteum]